MIQFSPAASFLLFAARSFAAPSVILPLDKQYVPLTRGDRVVAHKTAYFGRIYVGLPQHQEFTVVFDTGSAHVFVPSIACANQTCQQHRRFDRSMSSSAVDIDHLGAPVPADAEERDLVSIAFGTGEVVGEFVREVVCLSNHSGIKSAAESDDCVQLRVILAGEMSDEPFRMFSFDGVIGLGLDALAVDPEFSFFGQMTKFKKQQEPRFGFFLSQIDSVPSEISFGGYDESRVQEPLRWAKVVRPELGHWQVSIRSIKIGGIEMPWCSNGACAGIVDSGTSLLGVPTKAAREMHWKLARKVTGDPDKLDCRAVGGPMVVIDLGGFEIELGPEDYSRPTAMQAQNKATGQAQIICRASLLPIDMDSLDDDKGAPATMTWIFGEPILRKYYTVFDWKQREIGFSRSKQPEASEISSSKHRVWGAPSEQPQAPVLMQI
mmetsp:Transcript_118995/g.210362  ORF Transcript_118995/g.210362 Transcript_118995/m.210362 type:complete len:435 (+) Transcript_118995:90-1394(+)